MKTKFRTFFFSTVLSILIGVIFAGFAYSQALEVITVPWVPGSPGIPHDTYNVNVK